MNCGAVTGFLPNFVGFPSLRGLHSSTVQPRRTPRRAKDAHKRVVRTPAGTTWMYVVPAGAPPAVRMRFPLVELSYPVSAASAASAPASPASPAGGPAAAGRTRTARRAAPGVAGTAGVGPPAVAAAAPAPVVPRLDPPAVPPRSPDRRVHHGRHDEQTRQDDKGDDGDGHDVTLLSFPEAAPRGHLAVLRDVEMPACLTCQSRVEEVQSFGAG